ncbi:MAG: FAD-dependent oxidoreductase, partial [Oscillospiraceae bacterium]|nr:FAD-dependent oxidoreductase [Oscillospiraceae bacterium]
FDLHDPRPENREYVRVSYYAIPPIYTIPYRSIYSKTVSNLLFASRLISVSHIAHGTTRLQRTLAAIGQAAGIAAALCGKFDCSPREIYRSHIETLRQRLLLNDASIPGAVNNDPLDVAKKASVSATSERRFSAETVSEWLPLSRPAGLMLWDFPKQLDSIAFLLRNQSDTDLTLRARLLLRKAEHPYKGHEPGKFPYERAVNEVEWGYDNSLSVFAEQGSAFAQLSPGEHQVCFDFGQKLIPKDPCCDENRYVIELEAKEKADCVLMAVDNGFYDFARLVVSGESAFDAQPKCPVFTISPEPLYAEAENVISGVNRRFSYNPVAMWQSDPASPFPQSVTLNFETPQSLSAVQVTFDTLERTYTEMPLDCGLRVSGRTVRAYSLEILANETWQMVAEERENYHRLCRHKFPAVKATALRLTVNAAWDNAYGARVYEIRAYEESCNII